MTVPPSGRTYDQSTKQVFARGTAAFAGILLGTIAVLEILQGISAIAQDDLYVEGTDYTYEFSLDQWGWTHLVLGVIALLVGIGIVSGNVWARMAGIVLAFLSILVNFAWLPYYPLWSLVVIAFGVFVIWALCTELAHEEP